MIKLVSILAPCLSPNDKMKRTKCYPVRFSNCGCFLEKSGGNRLEKPGEFFFICGPSLLRGNYTKDFRVKHFSGITV